MVKELKTDATVRRAVNNYYRKLTAYDRTKQQSHTFVRKHARLEDIEELIRLYNETHNSDLELLNIND